MKKMYYELIFDCCETCQNGKERRIKKSVLTPVFNDGKFITELDRIKNCVEVLMQEHYYDIAYIKTKVKYILIAE